MLRLLIDVTIRLAVITSLCISAPATIVSAQNSANQLYERPLTGQVSSESSSIPFKPEIDPPASSTGFMPITAGYALAVRENLGQPDKRFSNNKPFLSKPPQVITATTQTSAQSNTTGDESAPVFLPLITKAGGTVVNNQNLT